MKRILCAVIVLACSLASLPSISAFAQTHRMTREQMRHWAHAYLTRFLSWFNAPINGDDRIFSQARQEIDADVKNGQAPNRLMSIYQADAKKYPHDPLAQFKFCYAGYIAATAAQNGIDYLTANQTFENFPTVAAYNNFPHAYNMVRLAFLWQGFFYAGPGLKNVGERLLAKDPSDIDVKYSLVRVLAATGNKRDIDTGIQYALELQRQQPDNANVYELLGGAYYSDWFKSPNNAIAAKAIAAFQQYLTLAPKDGRYRAVATFLIDRINGVK